MTTRRIALPLSAFRRIKNNPPCGLSSLARGIFLFGSLRIDDARFGVVNLFVIFKAINRDRYIIDAINNRERLRKIAFPNVSDQFIFCKNTDGGRAFVFARFQTTVNSDPVAFAIQLRKNTLAAIECYAGHRQRKNAVRSFKFASAGFCFRLRAGFFLLLQARFGGGFTRLFLFGKSYKSKDNGNGNTGSEFADPVRKEGEGT